jgi:hypothetical protein
LHGFLHVLSTQEYRSREGSSPAESLRMNPEIVDDFLATCFEGGSNYWIESVDVSPSVPPTAPYEFASEALTRGGELDIVTLDGAFRLTLRKMEEGIVMAARYRKWDVDRLYDDFDADDADRALQYALLDDIVYG